MSRSRKKTPSVHYVVKRGWMKKDFNRRLRRNFVVDEEKSVSAIPDGNAYRRVSSLSRSKIRCRERKLFKDRLRKESQLIHHR